MGFPKDDHQPRAAIGWPFGCWLAAVWKYLDKAKKIEGIFLKSGFSSCAQPRDIEAHKIIIHLGHSNLSVKYFFNRHLATLTSPQGAETVGVDTHIRGSAYLLSTSITLFCFVMKKTTFQPSRIGKEN